MADIVPSIPEKEQVELQLPSAGVTITNFTEYTFNSHFLTPTDGFSFTIAAERLSDEMKDALKVGVPVKLSIRGTTQASGYIDSIEIASSRASGTEWRIEGRDRLGQVVDACADPTQSFKPGQTLADALKSLFAPFGWSTDDQFSVANDASRDVKTGQSTGTPMTHGGKKKGPKPLKDYVLHQLRPHSREGVFEFAARIAQRFALWIWLSADGEVVIISRPDFDVPPIYELRRGANVSTNILEGSVKFDMADQPTVIIADGFSGGGEFGRGRIKSILCNTAVCTTDPAFLDPWKKYPDAKRVDGHFFETPVQIPRAKTLILHDDESQTQEQLDNFVRREMALHQRRSLQVHYTVEGHGQLIGGDFAPWTVDTTVRVEDDIAGLHETLYVLSRTFRKSRSGGTTTQLELIRLNTISFGEPPLPAPRAPSGAPKLQENIVHDIERPIYIDPTR